MRDHRESPVSQTTKTIEASLPYLITQPTDQFRLGDYLLENFADQQWTEFRAAVAFVKQSGMRHIADALHDFSARSRVRLSVGVDCRGTSVEGLTSLLNAVARHGEVWVFHNENDSTFHPKVYLFKNDVAAIAAVGSGNLTGGGLFANYEASLVVPMNLAEQSDRELLAQLEATLDAWCDENNGTARKLDEQLLRALVEQGYVVTEAQSRAKEKRGRGEIGGGDQEAGQQALFRSVDVPRAPAQARRGGRQPADIAEELSADIRAGYKGFVMILKQTDAGVGQTGSGTARRSPEIFVPLAARDFAPEFWGWRDLFLEDTVRAGKWDRQGVRVRLGSQTIEVNMMTWPIRHDFRLRSETLRSAGKVDDVLRLERAPEGADFDYYAEIIPQGTSQYDYYIGLCDHPVRNSEKRWGYYL